MSDGGKAGAAFRTIGEVSQSTGIAQHVLRYWETRFPKLRPVTRAGNRRYYRPEDVALVERIDRLLNHDGYTVKGVQKLLADEARGGSRPAERASAAPTVAPTAIAAPSQAALRAIRDTLQRALDAA